MDSTFERICALVAEVTGKPVSGRGDQRKGLCPAHDDEQASLSIRNTEPVGVTCFAGCTFEDITHALGLSARDFRSRSGKRTSAPPGQERARPADQRPGGGLGQEVARYPYTDPAGDTAYYNIRFNPKAFRMAGPDGVVKPLPKTVKRIPYNLPAVLAAIARGQTVYWVEGEKDVATLARHGLVGTTAAGGVSAPIDPDWARLFDGADLVVIADNDDVGRSYARRIARLMVNRTVRCRVATVGVQAPKADITDHFEAGLDLADLAYQDRWVRRTQFDFDQILSVPKLDIQWVLNGIIPQASGVTLLVGAPKAGKSWFCLQLFLAVSSGDFPNVFGWGEKADPAPCLYLALEDNAPRLSYRLNKMRDGTVVPDRIRRESKIWLDLAELAEGGADQIRGWLDSNPDARLVIVDVLAKVRGEGTSDGNAYQADYFAINQLKDIADEYGVTFVVTHHDRKLKHNGDFFDQISGTKGITGAADTILYLKRDRGSDEGNIEMSGRDVEEARFVTQFVREHGRWEIVSQGEIESAAAEGAERRPLSEQLADLVEKQGPVTVDDATAALDKSRATIYRCVKDSPGLTIRDGLIVSSSHDAVP